MQKNHSFLKQLALRCYEQFGETCDTLTVVFPNKRAGLYFTHHLAQHFTRPVWSPKVYSLEEFVEQQQDESLANDFQLVFLLYQAYAAVTHSRETFDAFLPWGEMLLQDFNDIDNFLIVPKHIFRVVESQKELDEAFQYLSEKEQDIIRRFWKSFLPHPTPKQQSFRATWAVLHQVYDRFHALLSERNLTYRGRMFRRVAAHSPAIDPDRSYWFAGFNALTQAEEQIIRFYLQEGNTTTHWDIDAYYFEDKQQEAGHFFRRYAKHPAFEKDIKDSVMDAISCRPTEVVVQAAPFGMGQVKALAEQLAHTDMTDAVIVLADESMLPEVMQHLPESTDAVNVTMGWAMAHTRVYTFLFKLLSLLSKPNRSHAFSLADWMTILAYADLLDIKKSSIHAFEQRAIKHQWTHPTLEEVEAAFPTLARLLSHDGDDSGCIANLMTFLATLSSSADEPLDRTVAARLHHAFTQTWATIESEGVTLSLPSWLKLLQRFGSRIKLPLSGDTMKGLQVMGVLETRNLSFENVFVVGMNEGNWPQHVAHASFIPYNIRRAFGLPTIEYAEAQQSYLFYRLLHSAQRLWLTYNHVTDFNHSGELSRYVQQLAYESKLNIEESPFLVSRMAAQASLDITIEKNEGVLAQLDHFVAQGHMPPKKCLSPSALNTYIDCKLKFYFQQLAKIKEPEVLKEDVDPSLFGQLMHHTMEHLYEGQEVCRKEDFPSLRKKLDPSIRAAFSKEKINLEQEATGKYWVTYEVIRKLARQILAYDEAHAPFEIIGLEVSDCVVDYPMEQGGKTKKVGLKGIIDRIDQRDNVIRILDYKSGRDERKFGEIAELFDASSTRRNKAVFQLMYYCMLYQVYHPHENRPIQPGMYNSKDLFSDGFDTDLTQTINRKTTPVPRYQDFEQSFKASFSTLLLEIFDPKIPFTQTTETKICAYCTYQNICARG